MSGYDLNRHKKSDKVKWVLSGIAFFLVIITIVGMCMQIWGKGKVKPSEWFKHEETEQTSPDTENEDTELSAGGATLSEGESNGMLLSATAIPLNAYEEYGVSALAESAQQITATIIPDTVDNKEVDWSIEWVNPNSAWASGKTVSNYVTVTPISNGALTATVECKQAFAEQINIIVTSRSASKVNAICKVDYLRKLTSTSFSSVCSLSAASNLALNDTSVINEWYWLPLTDLYSSPTDWRSFTNTYADNYSELYTIDRTVTSRTLTMSASSQLISALDSVGSIETFYRNYYKKSYTYDTSYDRFFGQGSVIGSYEYEQDGLFHFMIDVYDSNGDCDRYNIAGYEIVKTALKACDIDLIFTLDITLSDGTVVSNTYNVNIVDSSLETIAQSVAISNSSIVF